MGRCNLVSNQETRSQDYDRVWKITQCQDPRRRVSQRLGWTHRLSIRHTSMPRCPNQKGRYTPLWKQFFRTITVGRYSGFGVATGTRGNPASQVICGDIRRLMPVFCLEEKRMTWSIFYWAIVTKIVRW